MDLSSRAERRVVVEVSVGVLRRYTADDVMGISAEVLELIPGALLVHIKPEARAGFSGATKRRIREFVMEHALKVNEGVGYTKAEEKRRLGIPYRLILKMPAEIIEHVSEQDRAAMLMDFSESLGWREDKYWEGVGPAWLVQALVGKMRLKTVWWVVRGLAPMTTGKQMRDFLVRIIQRCAETHRAVSESRLLQQLPGFGMARMSMDLLSLVFPLLPQEEVEPFVQQIEETGMVQKVSPTLLAIPYLRKEDRKARLHRLMLNLPYVYRHEEIERAVQHLSQNDLFSLFSGMGHSAFVAAHNPWKMGRGVQERHLIILQKILRRMVEKKGSEYVKDLLLKMERVEHAAPAIFAGLPLLHPTDAMEVFTLGPRHLVNDDRLLILQIIRPILTKDQASLVENHWFPKNP